MSTQIGKIGEDLACGYLVNNGYQIIDRNYRKQFGEIDIIAKSPDNTLVFVEVKTTTASGLAVDKSPASYPHLAGLNSGYLKEINKFVPEDHMTHSKITRFRRISEWYANSHQELSKQGYRLDVIAIEINGDLANVRYYRNI